MNLYDEKIIVAIEDAVQNMVEASGITADVFRLDGDRVIDALLQALGDEYVIIPKTIPENVVNRLKNSSYHWGEHTKDYFSPIYELMVEEAARGGNE